MSSPDARCLAVGDIHGCLDALRTLAEFVPFRDDDLIVTLGDYVDRGPDTRGVLDWLLDYSANGKLIALRGNHDVLMLEARHGSEAYARWLEFGGDAVLRSYDSGGLDGVPAAHWQFLEERCRPYYEVASHFFVHGNVDPEVALAEQDPDVLYWRKLHGAAPHCSGKTMVCGHTSQKSGLPHDLGFAVCIDTWAYGNGWLTCLDVAANEYWQANQSGRCRRGRLSPALRRDRARARRRG